MQKPITALALALLATVAARGSADVITIGANHDATIYSGASNKSNSNGGGPGIFSGTDGGPQSLRGLMSFDIADNVPAGSTITGVQLTLTLGMAAGSGGGGGDKGARTIELHRLLDSWGEGTTGSSSTVIGGTGQGFAAGAGDATWNARFFSSTTPTLWTMAGGDFAVTASGSDAVGSTSGELDKWLSTPGMVADVQSWLDTRAGNNGWELINTDETDTRTFRAYWTHEAIVAANRPQLQITFTPVPEPVAFASLGAIGILFRRRR